MQSKAEPCLFVHQSRPLRILLYVDDILCATERLENSDWLYSKLSERFTTKNLGNVTKLLGIRITRNCKAREIYLDLKQYLESVLNKHGFPVAKYCPRGTLMREYNKLQPT